jgi:hypothetical protein
MTWFGGTTVCNNDEDPEPVEVVSEIDDPDENGGKDRSDGDGDEGGFSPPLKWRMFTIGDSCRQVWGCK